MVVRPLNVDVMVGNHGLQISSSGDGLLIRARFSREKDDLERFLSDLRSAIQLWCRHHPSSKEPSDAGKVPIRGPQIHDSGYLAKIRLPKTTHELKMLNQLAIQGPAAVYAWIYGSQSMMAKAMDGTTWKQFGVENPNEGCERILQSIRDHHDDLRTLRPHLHDRRTAKAIP